MSHLPQKCPTPGWPWLDSNTSDCRLLGTTTCHLFFPVVGSIYPLHNTPSWRFRLSHWAHKPFNIGPSAVTLDHSGFLPPSSQWQILHTSGSSLWFLAQSATSSSRSTLHLSPHAFAASISCTSARLHWLYSGLHGHLDSPSALVWLPPFRWPILKLNSWLYPPFLPALGVHRMTAVTWERHDLSGSQFSAHTSSTWNDWRSPPPRVTRGR